MQSTGSEVHTAYMAVNSQKTLLALGCALLNISGQLGDDICSGLRQGKVVHVKKIFVGPCFLYIE